MENYEQLDDKYSLAIASYALQLAKHDNKDVFLKQLDTKAESKDGLKYWSKEIKNDSKENHCWHPRPNSVNVEMSAYALQAFIDSGKDSDGIPIMKWLVSQRNENGGFQSTQDTVVGLQALSKLAAKIYDADSDIEISVKSENPHLTVINVNNSNSLILQKFEVPSSSRHFEVSAKGKGFSILQVAYRYNLDESPKFPKFVINPKIEDESTKEVLNLSIGLIFIADALIKKSNMAVMEIALPSGFTFDTESLEKLMQTAKVKVKLK
jgi:CD109 antigen